MAFFSTDMLPLVKAAKFSLKQLDEESSERYTFVCCARRDDGKLALLHASAISASSARNVKDITAVAMKRLFDAFKPSCATGQNPSPRASGGQEQRLASVLGSAPASGAASATGGSRRVSADASATSLGSLTPTGSPSVAGSSVDGESSQDVPEDLPPLPDSIAIPELVGGGYEYEADGGEDRRAQRAHQDARPAAALAHRARLNALAAQQKAEVRLDDELVSSVRLKLCRGDRRRLVLADLLTFYEVMAYYCKGRLELSQVVYENLAPLATLGISVKVTKSHVRNSPLIVVPLKMGNRSQMRVPAALALLCYMVHIKDGFFQFVLDQVASGKRVSPQQRSGRRGRESAGSGERGDADATGDVRGGGGAPQDGAAAAGSDAAAGAGDAAAGRDGAAAPPHDGPTTSAAPAGGASPPPAGGTPAGADRGGDHLPLPAVPPPTHGESGAGPERRDDTAAAPRHPSPTPLLPPNAARESGAKALLVLAGARTPAPSPSLPSRPSGAASGHGGRPSPAAAGSPSPLPRPADTSVHRGGRSTPAADTPIDPLPPRPPPVGGPRTTGGGPPTAAPGALPPLLQPPPPLLGDATGAGPPTAVGGTTPPPPQGRPPPLVGPRGPGDGPRAAVVGVSQPPLHPPAPPCPGAGGGAQVGDRRARPPGGAQARAAELRRAEGDADVGGALARARAAGGQARGVGASARGSLRGAPVARQYSNPSFVHLVAQTGAVTQASFRGRFADISPPGGTSFACPAVQDLYHAGKVVARGLVDVDYELVPYGKLPSRFSAVTVRTVLDNSSDISCWSWGNGILTESFLGLVSVHTLVWETRMTGYVSSRALCLFVRVTCVWPVCVWVLAALRYSR